MKRILKLVLNGVEILRFDLRNLKKMDCGKVDFEGVEFKFRKVGFEGVEFENFEYRKVGKKNRIFGWGLPRIGGR